MNLYDDEGDVISEGIYFVADTPEELRAFVNTVQNALPEIEEKYQHVGGR